MICGGCFTEGFRKTSPFLHCQGLPSGHISRAKELRLAVRSGAWWRKKEAPIAPKDSVKSTFIFDSDWQSPGQVSCVSEHFRSTRVLRSGLHYLPYNVARSGNPNQKSIEATLNLQVSKGEWNSCLAASEEENPFLRYEFLYALEQSGCTSRRTGWQPYHVCIKRTADKKLLACCPMYIKSHSRGEYVFDYQWAEISEYTGTRYYPKLQSCVPFTPVPGTRYLRKMRCIVDQSDIGYWYPKKKERWISEDCSLKGSDRLQVRLLSRPFSLPGDSTDNLDLSSAHITFNLKEEQELVEEEGYISKRYLRLRRLQGDCTGRMGIQYHWQNRDYATFDEFLMDLKQSKRKNIRQVESLFLHMIPTGRAAQERKSIVKNGIKIERLVGDDIKSHHWDDFYKFYLDTCNRKWGPPYLNREFFQILGESMGDKILLVLAKTDVDGYIAGAWNCIGSHCLFGRNWGKLGTQFYKNLHFELCYYQAIDAAIEMGLQRVEAGAQGEHKIQRGYRPTATYSSHYIRDDRANQHINRITRLETLRMMETLDYLIDEYSPFKEEAVQSE